MEKKKETRPGFLDWNMFFWKKNKYTIVVLRVVLHFLILVFAFVPVALFEMWGSFSVCDVDYPRLTMSQSTLDY